MCNTTDFEMNNLLHNIKHLRISNNISKKQMAKMLGIGLKTLNKIENGEMPPKLGASVLCNISKHFNISTYKLFEHKFLEPFKR